MSLGLADEEDGPIGGDETSMRPVLNSTNVEPEMLAGCWLVSPENRADLEEPAPKDG